MNELLMESTSVMLIGMGTVFLFLCVMIVVMHIMAAVIKKLNILFPEAVPQTAGKARKTSGDDSEIAAAIIAAMFRKK